jgi:hypothetical protein
VRATMFENMTNEDLENDIKKRMLLLRGGDAKTGKFIWHHFNIIMIHEKELKERLAFKDISNDEIQKKIGDKKWILDNPNNFKWTKAFRKHTEEMLEFFRTQYET